jgi:hypothetical protein
MDVGMHRWYKKPDMDIIHVPYLIHDNLTGRPPADMSLTSNPLYQPRPTSSSPLLPSPKAGTHFLRPTDTLPARVVYSEAQAALKPLMARVQTVEQLERLKESLESAQYVPMLNERCTLLIVAPAKNNHLALISLAIPPLSPRKVGPAQQDLRVQLRAPEEEVAIHGVTILIVHTPKCPFRL